MSRLWLFFLRAAPVRAAGVISGVVAIVLMATLMTLQAFSLSGEQRADQAIGAADFALPTGTTVPLGANGQATDDALKETISRLGGVSPRVQYTVLDAIELTGNSASATVAVEETRWPDEPFPRSFRLMEGNWPAEPAEAAVSAALADTFPVGSSVELFDGAWSATITGIVYEEFARTGATVFLAEGAWSSMAGTSNAERYETGATRTIYWSGGESTEIIQHLAPILQSENSMLSSEQLMVELQSRDELVSRGSEPLIEFRLAALLAPLAAAVTGVLLAMRFANRVRDVMASVGISYERTRKSVLTAITVSLTAGVIIGSTLGIGVGFGLRPVLDAASIHTLGPVHDLGTTFVWAALSTLIGASLAVGLNVTRRSSAPIEHVSRRTIPTPYVILPLLSLAWLVAGYMLAQSARSVDEIILAGVLFAMAGVTLLPLALTLAIRREPTRLPARLALRGLRGESRQAGWVTAIVSSLLVVGFATSTLMTSSLVTVNASNYASVPYNQIHLTLPDGAPTELEQEVSQFLGMESPLTFHIADGGVTIMDGATVVVDSHADFDALTGVSLTASQRELLTAGGTIRSKTPELSEVTFRSADGNTFVMPSITVDALAQGFQIYDGIILRSTAESNGVGLVRKTQAYLNPTPEQFARASEASIALGFNTQWLAFNKTPDVFEEPLEARISAAIISLLAIAVLIGFARSSTKFLRPKLAALRSVGIGQRWLGEVLAGQVSLVLVVSMGGAALSAVVGMFGAIVVSGLDIMLITPWQSIGISVASLVIGAAMVMFVSARRLKYIDRFVAT